MLSAPAYATAARPDNFARDLLSDKSLVMVKRSIVRFQVP